MRVCHRFADAFWRLIPDHTAQTVDLFSFFASPNHTFFLVNYFFFFLNSICDVFLTRLSRTSSPGDILQVRVFSLLPLPRCKMGIMPQFWFRLKIIFPFPFLLGIRHDCLSQFLISTRISDFFFFCLCFLDPLMRFVFLLNFHLFLQRPIRCLFPSPLETLARPPYPRL